MISELDVEYMKQAIELSKNCSLSYGAYSVGAIIVDASNEVISTGYSRETADNVHAEEVAMNKAIKDGIELKGTTIYSTMEPCGLRLSGKECCADKIINASMKRVVFGVKEPSHLVKDTTGIEKIQAANVECEQIKEFEEKIFEINSHIKASK